MTIREAINSGCRFRDPYLSGQVWFFIKGNSIYYTSDFNTTVHKYSEDIQLFFNHYYIDRFILHPEDEAKLKFNKKIEDLISDT